MNNNTMLSDIHRNVVAGQEGSAGRNQSVSVVFYPSTTKH